MQLPGFIDLQINGYKGINFSSDKFSETDFRLACDQILANGNAAILPTVCTSPMESYEHTLPTMAKILKDPKYQGKLPGLHLEGPFMSPAPGAVGAHHPDWMLEAKAENLDKLIELSEDNISLLTIAADKPGAAELCSYARSKNITVSLGHQMATNEDLAVLADADASLLTHLGNGLPNDINRHNNPLYAGLANDDLTAMIITDGHHLPAHLIKIMLRVKSVDKIIVTSDASTFAGMPPGRYERPNNLCILEESGLLHNPEKGCMVGSSYTMLECMNYLAPLEFLSTAELKQVSFDNPLAAIGLSADDIDCSQKLHYDEVQKQYQLL